MLHLADERDACCRLPMEAANQEEGKQIAGLFAALALTAA
jgi:hypothetical protein